MSRTVPSPPLPHAAVRSPGARRVLLLGGDADHNLGDQAILYALCDALARSAPGIEITLASAQPDRAGFPGVTEILAPSAGGFAALVTAAARQDLVLVGGGGLLQDDDSRAKMPYWASRLALLRLANREVHVHAVGAGPLEHAESRAFARLICAQARSVSVRDEFARGWLARCSRRPIEIAPDPAFGLPPAPVEAAERRLRQLGLEPGRPVLGVALRRWYHRRGGFVPHRVRAAAGLDRGCGAAAMDRMIDQIAAAVAGLARRLDASVLLMPSYNVGHEADVRQCRALADRLVSDRPSVSRPSDRLPAARVHLGVFTDARVYKAVCGRLALMLSARMHPLILAAGMGVPGVGLAYNGKFEGFFDAMRLPRRLLWLDDFRCGSQHRHLEALAGGALGERGDLRHRAQLLAQQSAGRLAALLERAGCAARAGA